MLRTHRAERANTRRHAEDATLFRLLVDRVLDYAMFLLTPDGHIASWNAGAERLKGYTADEIIGEHFARFYPDETRRAGLPQRLLSIARSEGRVENEGWRVRKDGSRFWADVVITALKDEHGELIGYAKVTRDLTDRHQAEKDRAARLAAEHAAERMERLQVATAALAAASRPEQAAEVLTDVTARAVGATMAAVAVPVEDGARLEVLDVRASRPSILRAHQQLGPDEPYLLAYTWRTNHALFVETREQVASKCPELAPLLTRSAMAAWAAIPLLVDGRSLGVLGLAFETPRALDADDRGFLLALAEVGAQAMDRARLYASEQQARTEAEAAVRAQDEFLSVAAHELRTPVAAVKATVQLAERNMVRGGLGPERMTAHLQRIGNAADRLAALIEDLLDVSRLRTGRVRLRCEQVDLRTLLDDIVGRYIATESRHQFSLSSPEGPLIIEADPLRIEQVVENLLSNAVKYSPNGGTIQLRLAHTGDGASLTVTDQGIGLPAGQEARIFEAFGRGSNATDQQIQGLGLGLAICRQLVDVHGGRIWATSPGLGQGTTFSVWLPLVAAASEERSPDQGAHA